MVVEGWGQSNGLERWEAYFGPRHCGFLVFFVNGNTDDFVHYISVL